jgi:hypothetical protein
VQNTKKADLHTSMLMVGSHFHESSRGRLEEQRKQKLLVLPDQRDQAVRNAEDNVKVADGQQLLSPIAEPLLASIDLTLRAMAIAAAKERDSLIPATGTSITMPTKSGSAAAHDGMEHLELSPAQRFPEALPQFAARHANDIGHLPEGPCH